MPALPSDIAAGTRAMQVETWSDAAIKARYPRARDGGESPAEGFFDNVADADLAIAQRGVLIGTERRRFGVTAAEIVWIDPAAGFPTARLRDAEQAVDAAGIVSRFELNLEAETTVFEVMV